MIFSLDYNKFLIVNIVISIILVTGVLVFAWNNPVIITQLGGIGVAFLLLLTAAKSDFKNPLSINPGNIKPKLVLFFGYVLALLLPFSHILFEFSNNAYLINLVYLVSTALFVSLFLLNDKRVFDW